MSFKRRVSTSVLLAVPLFVWPVAAISQAQQSGADAIDYAVFKDPPAQYRGHAMLGFGPGNLTEERAASIVGDLVKNGYGGFSPLTGGTADTPYLSDGYFAQYKMILDEAKKNGLTVVVYDDSSCPTGCLGGQFYLKEPRQAAKSLDMVEKNVTGPAKAELAIP
ncbi:MAG: hypothetical protein WAU78_10155, partial [Roseiarcus sp.]